MDLKFEGDYSHLELIRDKVEAAFGTSVHKLWINEK